MKTIRFKTNINCGSCVEKVTPVLNEDQNIEKWEVDTTNPDKILTIHGEEINEQEIIQKLQNIGYKAESL